MRGKISAREGLPLSHYAARQTCEHIIDNGMRAYSPTGRRQEDYLTLRKVGDNLAVLAPAYNGSPEWDAEVLKAVLSAPMLTAVAEATRRGGDDLTRWEIALIAKHHAASVGALLAYFGSLIEHKKGWATYEQRALIPIDLSDADLLAVFMHHSRHWPGARATMLVIETDWVRE